MMHEAGAAVRNGQVTFAFFDGETRRQVGRMKSGGVPNYSGWEERAVRHPNSSFANLGYGTTRADFGTILLCALKQEPGRGRWIQDNIFRNEQTSNQAGAQIWFQATKIVRVE